MPIRTLPLVNDQYYHIYNRGVAKRPIFIDKRDYSRMMETVRFYRYSSPPVKLSHFLKLSNEQRINLMKKLEQFPTFLISTICFVFLPNHFHFLLRQQNDGGISKFIKNISDSYTRYFNTRHKRIGPLLQGQFKAVRIESDEQLLHLSRYIHLNPYTSYLIKTLDELPLYPWSSLPQYLGQSGGVCEKGIILNAFSSSKKYWQFLTDQADYQRQLDNIKHLALEE